MSETTIERALPAMQALASRIWSPASRHHPGQLAWSAGYGEDLGHGPVWLEEHAWAWAESDDWLEICVDPAHADRAPDLVAWFLDRAPEGPVTTMVLETEEHLLAPLRAAGFGDTDFPWFTHHTLDLARMRPVPELAGYTFRHVTPDEHEARAGVHRAAWSSMSKVTTAAYDHLATLAPYRHETDWVAEDAEGTMVASCCVWLDAVTGVALVEPVGTVEEHRGRGLAGAVSLAALGAARDLGGTTGLVCPRGDDDYPVPQQVYRGIGFEPGPRTLTLQRA